MSRYLYPNAIEVPIGAENINDYVNLSSVYPIEWYQPNFINNSSIEGNYCVVSTNFGKFYIPLNADFGGYTKEMIIDYTCQEIFWPPKICAHSYRTFKLYPEDVIFDIGACEGLFSLYALSYGCSVIAIEPEILWFNALQKTCASHKAVLLINQALSNSTDDLKGVLCNSLLMSNTVGSGKEQIFKSTTLDKIVEYYKLKKVSVLKLDVEGFEGAVLSGAEKTLKEFHPYLAIAAYHRAEDAKNLIKQVWDFGYEHIVLQGITNTYGTISVIFIHCW